MIELPWTIDSYRDGRHEHIFNNVPLQINHDVLSVASKA